MLPAGKTRPDPGAVTSKALLRAGALLDLPSATLARIIGVSGASLSRLTAGTRTIDAQSKEGELALLLLRAFRSLDALFGGNHEQSRQWLTAFNHHLGGEPVALLETPQGLVHVADYLDALRGQG